MSAVFDARSAWGAVAAIEWLPVIAGLLLLYAPTFYGLATGIWGDDDYAHGPIILGTILWLMWRKRAVLLAAPAPEATLIESSHAIPVQPASAAPAPAPGFTLIVVGLLLYFIGRSQDITLFEVSSLAPVLAGVLLAMRGWLALRSLWFPILFVAFMVPLPGFFVDALSGPLKQSVSAIAEQLLFAAGYPIARSGVVLAIGQYQLLVGDACSGLNSMFSLSALGLLFLYLMRRRSWLHNGLILAGILPIAFAANIVRVLVLVLVTYHFGDDAGQGFLHRGAGIVLLVVALIVIFLLDAILARAIKPRIPV